MSEERHETVADIVAEMRCPYYKMGRSNATLDKDMMGYMSFMADRIEKAADATYREKLYEYAILWDYDNSLFVKSIDYSYIKQKMDEVNADGPVCHLVRREVGEWEELPWRTENDARKNGGLPEDGYALFPLVCDLLSIVDRIEAANRREVETLRALLERLLKASVDFASCGYNCGPRRENCIIKQAIAYLEGHS